MEKFPVFRRGDVFGTVVRRLVFFSILAALAAAPQAPKGSGGGEGKKAETSSVPSKAKGVKPKPLMAMLDLATFRRAKPEIGIDVRHPLDDDKWFRTAEGRKAYAWGCIAS